MAATITTTPTALFPMGQVRAALEAELIDVARNEAMIRGIKLPSDLPSVRAAAVPMDSLTVVDSLCVLDQIVGFKLKENLVQTGGYDSVDEAVEHLIPRIQRAWDNKQKKKKGGK